MSLPDGDRVPITVPLAGVAVVDNAVTLVIRSYLVPLDGILPGTDESAPVHRYSNSLRRRRDTSDSGGRLPSADIAQADHSHSGEAVDHRIRRGNSAGHRGGGALREAEPRDRSWCRWPTGRTARPNRPHRWNARSSSARAPRSRSDCAGSSGVPSLLISGPPNQLVNQSRLLSSDVSRLAVSSRAVVGPLKSTPQLPADMTTIRQLGQPGVNATALSPQVSIGLDQTRLGRSVRNVRVHLRGSYTPLPTSVGGSVVAAINGETIDQWPTDGTGSSIVGSTFRIGCCSVTPTSGWRSTSPETSGGAASFSRSR